jgi:hypothetical protein
MAQRAIGTLTDAERTHLLPLTKRDQVAARQLRRAHTRLQADAGATAETIAAARPLGLTSRRVPSHALRRRGPRGSADRASPSWGATSAGWDTRGLPQRLGLQDAA